MQTLLKHKTKQKLYIWSPDLTVLWHIHGRDHVETEWGPPVYIEDWHSVTKCCLHSTPFDSFAAFGTAGWHTLPFLFSAKASHPHSSHRTMIFSVKGCCSQQWTARNFSSPHMQKPISHKLRFSPVHTLLWQTVQNRAKRYYLTWHQ